MIKECTVRDQPFEDLGCRYPSARAQPMPSETLNAGVKSEGGASLTSKRETKAEKETARALKPTDRVRETVDRNGFRTHSFE